MKHLWFEIMHAIAFYCDDIFNMKNGIIHENSDKYFENKCLYHVRWFYILCMMSYSDDWNNDWNDMNDDLESCI